MKIFLGTSEIAGMMNFLSSALKGSGHEVATFIDNAGAGYFNFEYDFQINSRPFQYNTSNRVIKKVEGIANSVFSSAARRRIFDKVKDEYDVFIFIWNGFAINDTWDYEYLKRRNKKIVSVFLGSDIRHISAFTQEYHLDVSTWEQWFHTMDINHQLFRLRKAEVYSDAIFSVPDQSGLSIRPYYKIFIPTDISRFRFNIPGRAVPKIVHIPSRTGIKGTTHIVQALEELKNEGLQFDFNFVTGISNDAVHELLFDADILVDQIFLHGPGGLSLEGIASGCAVAAKTFADDVYADALCNVDIHTLKDKLRKLITDVEYRTRLTKTAFDTIKYYNDPVRIATDMVKKALTGPSATQFDYYPKFFSDHYKLPEHSSLRKRNIDLTREVIDKYNLHSSLNVTRMKAEGLA